VPVFTSSAVHRRLHSARELSGVPADLRGSVRVLADFNICCPNCITFHTKTHITLRRR